MLEHCWLAIHEKLGIIIVLPSFAALAKEIPWESNLCYQDFTLQRAMWLISNFVIIRGWDTLVLEFYLTPALTESVTANLHYTVDEETMPTVIARNSTKGRLCPDEMPRMLWMDSGPKRSANVVWERNVWGASRSRKLSAAVLLLLGEKGSRCGWLENPQNPYWLSLSVVYFGKILNFHFTFQIFFLSKS